MSSEKRIVVVTGATGAQGGSVVNTLLDSGEYHIRAVLRNPDSEKAQPLLDRGVEIVKADINDKASLIQAFKGAHAILGVTDFYEPFRNHGPKEAERIELIQAKNLADAAAATDGLSHYIWSTCPCSADSEYRVPHFDAKADADEYIISQLPDLAAKTTFLWATVRAENLTDPLMTPTLIKSSGKYGWVLPIGADTPITTIGPLRKNVGMFVEAILKRPEVSKGRYVLAGIETLTVEELLQRWGKITGKPTVHIPTSLEVYDQLYPGWGAEIGVMLQFWEAVGARSWSKTGETILTKEDLGIDESQLVGLDAAIAEIDWTNV
ncbi:hypothetical protein BJY04DRAFT_228793 [Aspergillus karnatakaensis]|uniref:NmrA/HSCARG family protein n=1 Tax=Aspergillus karnatakaensis TaxID=1810916 RepID=UPI003CCE1F6E